MPASRSGRPCGQGLVGRPGEGEGKRRAGSPGDPTLMTGDCSSFCGLFIPPCVGWTVTAWPLLVTFQSRRKCAAEWLQPWASGRADRAACKASGQAAGVQVQVHAWSWIYTLAAGGDGLCRWLIVSCKSCHPCRRVGTVVWCCCCCCCCFVTANAASLLRLCDPRNQLEARKKRRVCV